jgi:outer membrane protein TolC
MTSHLVPGRLRALCLALIVVGIAGSAGERAWAQGTAPVLRLSPEEAVASALDHNLALRGARLGPQLADLDVNVARTAWTPQLSTRFVNIDSQAPPTSPFDQTQPALLDRQVTSELGLAQQLPWGTAYRVGWTGARRSNSSFLARFRPELSSGATATLIQPLLKGLTFDAARASRDVSLRNRDIAAADLDTALASTRREVLSAYWTWVYARQLLGVRQQSLSLAATLLEGNRRRIAVGAMATVDAIEAEAEVARRSEAIIIAEKDVANAEDQVRLLIFDPGDPRYRDALEPDGRLDDTVAAPPADIVERALAGRQDLRTIRQLVEVDQITVRQSRNDALPDATLRVDYSLRATGGTELLRDTAVTGAVTGSVQRSFASVLDDLARSRYPTWSVELAVSYPLGTAKAEASTARAVIAQRRREASLAAAEQQTVTEVTAAQREVSANAKRLDSTAIAVTLSERRLDAEERKFTVGLSTSFFVFQAQRDLASAREAQLRSALDHRLSWVDLEAIQTIPVRGTSAASANVPR